MFIIIFKSCFSSYFQKIWKSIRHCSLHLNLKKLVLEEDPKNDLVFGTRFLKQLPKCLVFRIHLFFENANIFFFHSYFLKTWRKKVISIAVNIENENVNKKLRKKLKTNYFSETIQVIQNIMLYFTFRIRDLLHWVFDLFDPNKK